MADLRNLKRRIGQRFILEFEGDVIPADLLRLDEQWGIGGYLLGPQNFSTFERLMDLADELWTCGQGTPPFIGASEIDDAAHGLPDPFTRFPALHQVGNVSSVSVSYEVGAVVGRELTAVGLNVFRIGLLDTNSVPASHTGKQPFAPEPEKRASLSRAMMRGLHDNAIIGCASTFPSRVPDGEIDAASLTLEALKTRLENFDKVMLSNPTIEMVQLAAEKYPQLDASAVPSLSQKIIQDILKIEFGFKGLVMTSDLTKIDKISAPKAAEKALNAGADLLYLGGDLDTQIATLEHMLELATTGAYPKHLWEHGYSRVRNIKAEHFRVIRNVDRAHAKELIGNREHQRISRRLKDGK